MVQRSIQRTGTCQNPDHSEVTGGGSREFAHKPGPGKPRKYCSDECSEHVKRYFRHDELGRPIRIQREYAAGSYEAAVREAQWWHSAGANRIVAAIPTEETNPVSALSLDMNMGTEPDPLTLGDKLASTLPSTEERLEFVSSVSFPFPGHAGMQLRLTYYRPVDPGMGYGDGVDVKVVRTSDGSVMSKSHPMAAEIVAELSSELWADRLHAFLEQLRQFDWPAGTAPTIPAQAATASLN